MHQEATILITKSFGDKVFFSRIFEAAHATQTLSNPGLGLIEQKEEFWRRPTERERERERVLTITERGVLGMF